MAPTTDSSYAVRLRGLSKYFPIRFGLGRKPVLRDIQLDVVRGQILGLVGPNGSGKSTLQKILAGVERQSSGQVEVLGATLDDDKLRARIGYVPEDSPFPGELKPRALLALLGSLQGMSANLIRSRGDELLERVGLADHTNKSLRRYSRGMLRRFALAQAWLHNPDLILLDEPTAGLDAPGFDVLEDLLSEARERGATIVFSSHLISDLHKHCDELVILCDGRIGGQGKPAELLSRPGCWRFEVSGMGPLQLDGLEDWVREHGGELGEVSASGRSLFELYKGQG
ncbi:MAG: ABC-2 type transport system ATP-binding protein [Planctomycetota bacterium]|jgi:ABC-2 type transport system ATP-binding protein